MPPLVGQRLEAASRPILVNARVRASGMAGTARYVSEMCKRLPVRAVTPRRLVNGMPAHAWEQICLPAVVRNRVLWSPASTGPLAVRAQVLTVHDLAPIDHPEWFNPKYAKWYGWLLPRLVRRVRRVIAVSSFTRERILSLGGIEPERVTVIHNGVDERFSARSPEEIAFTLESLRIPSRKYFLYVGSIEPRKGLKVLLSAWKRALPHLPRDLWLLIVGAQGSHRVFAGSRAPRGDRVHYSGFVPDLFLPALYSGAIALAYPSAYEGFGLPALEAMACGTPPIVSDRTATRELVADAGLCVDVSDPAVLASSIGRFCLDRRLREECAAKAIERSRLFTWERAAEQVLSTLIEARDT